VNNPNRAWILAGGLGLLAALASVWSLWSPPGGSQHDEKEIRRAIESAAAYLGSVTLRGDDAWIATQGARKLGPEFRLWAETLGVDSAVEADFARDPLSGGSSGAGAEGHLWSLRWLDETPLPPLPLPMVPAPRTVSTRMTDADILVILRMMSQAVACNRLGEADRQAWVTQLQAEAQGYVLTHQLIALLLGLHQGCIDTETAAPARALLAGRLWAEHHLDRSGINDLSIERLAVLCYAQVCDWITDDWFAELLRAQQPSGSWGTNLDANVHPRVVAREEHGAAIAFYVLASVWAEQFPDADPPDLPPKP
jgi:hypothetical protein